MRTHFIRHAPAIIGHGLVGCATDRCGVCGQSSRAGLVLVFVCAQSLGAHAISHAETLIAATRVVHVELYEFGD